MRVIIAGSRGIVDIGLIPRAVRESGFDVSEVVSGCARGVDRLGSSWARSENKPVQYFSPDWKGYGKRAGFVRNSEMADNADALIAIWDGRSRGTQHMIEIAKKRGLRVFVYSLPGKNPLES